MIYLDVCCNDPDNGIFDHCAPALQVGDCEFEAKLAHVDRSPRFVETSTGIRLAGKNWKIESSKDWYGNWCWNRYLLWQKGTTPRWYMVEFLTWLKGRNPQEHHALADAVWLRDAHLWLESYVFRAA